MSRILKNEHVRLGWFANSERKQAKWKVISSISSYEARGIHGQQMIGITIDGGSEGQSVIYLSQDAGLEIIKGLLMDQIRKPISMTADEEFRAILQQVLAAIKSEEDDVEAAVKAAREFVQRGG